VSATERDLPFVCIIGAPRSGTTWLQALIGAHPRVSTTQELKLFDLFTGPWERSWRQLLELQRSAGGGPRGLRVVWSDDEFYGLLGGVVKGVHARVLAGKPGATVVLDKSPGYSPYVAHIRRLVPQVKFIHVVRDGRDVAVSLRVAATGWARAWAPGSIASAASLWRSMVTAAREAEATGPSGYLEIRYEEMQADAAASLMRAFSFMGLPATPEDASEICERHTLARMQDGAGPFDLPREFFRRGEVGGWRAEMKPMERYRFEEAAGDLLCELGYARSGWWVERRLERWLLPALATASVRHRVRALAQRMGAAAGVPRDA
jgi:Sulfotransferase family